MMEIIYGIAANIATELLLPPLLILGGIIPSILVVRLPHPFRILAVPAICLYVNLLNSRHQSIRRSAELVLRLSGERGLEILLDELKKDSDPPQTLLSIMGRMDGMRGFDATIKCWADNDKNDSVKSRIRTVWSNWSKRDEARGPLLGYLKDSKSSTHLTAAVTATSYIAEKDDSDILGLLRAFLGDDEPLSLVIECIDAIASLDDNNSEIHLRKLLQKAPDFRIRQAAARALGRIGFDRAVSALKGALADEAVRREAVAALVARRENPKAALALWEFASDTTQTPLAHVDAFLGLVEIDTPEAREYICELNADPNLRAVFIRRGN